MPRSQRNPKEIIAELNAILDKMAPGDPGRAALLVSIAKYTPKRRRRRKTVTEIKKSLRAEVRKEVDEDAAEADEKSASLWWSTLSDDLRQIHRDQWSLEAARDGRGQGSLKNCGGTLTASEIQRGHAILDGSLKPSGYLIELCGTRIETVTLPDMLTKIQEHQDDCYHCQVSGLQFPHVMYPQQ